MNGIIRNQASLVNLALLHLNHHGGLHLIPCHTKKKVGGHRQSPTRNQVGGHHLHMKKKVVGYNGEVRQRNITRVVKVRVPRVCIFGMKEVVGG